VFSDRAYKIDFGGLWRVELPVRMDLPTVQEDPLAMHKEAVFVPGDLQQSMLAHPIILEHKTHDILQHLPLNQNILRRKRRRSRRRANRKQRHRTQALEKTLHLAAARCKVRAIEAQDRAMNGSQPPKYPDEAPGKYPDPSSSSQLQLPRMPAWNGDMVRQRVPSRINAHRAAL
jgi:hypothetical protein